MEESILHRKERLIITTIEIIDELGIQGLSTREIARRQNVSEATLFRHFKSKNNLLNAVLDYYSQFDRDIFESTRLRKLGAKDAITFYITSFVEYYENYPAITSIMHLLEVLRYEADLTEKVNNIQNNRTKYLNQLIDDGKQAGVINKSIDSNYLSDIISGICREVCLNWRLNGKNFPLKERTLATVDFVLNTFMDVTHCTQEGE